MSCKIGKDIIICGNFARLTKRRPKNWIDKDYKIRVPYKFKWRVKLGRAKCNCKEIEEHFQPWYGFTWIHSENCAIMKHIEKYPGINNLIDRDLSIIAQSE